MLKFFLPVILLLAALNCVAQKDSVRKYLDAELHFTTKKDFVYAAMAIKSEGQWVLYVVYPDTSVFLKITFKDAALTIKDGPFFYYYPKNKAAQICNFKNNIVNGHWQSWYPNGQLKNEGDIINNHFSGAWKEWYKNGQTKTEQTYVYTDSAGMSLPVHENSPAAFQRVVDDFKLEGTLEGIATTWYENGNKESILHYSNDSLTGQCAWFRENGNPSSKETYVKGKVTELECFDEDGKYTGATCSILKLPVLVHPFFTLLDYIENELHKEKLKDVRMEGEVTISFIVTKKGTVENLMIVSSPDVALNKHIVQIFTALPRWSPAITHNRAVDYPVKLVIPYYRD